MEIEKQSRLERILRFAKITAGALVLSLIPNSEMVNSSQQETSPKKESFSESDEKEDLEKLAIEQDPTKKIIGWTEELGRAKSLLKDFPIAYQIPGIKQVYKFENPEANYLLVYFRMGYHPKEKMSRAYKKTLIAINNDACKGFSFLQEKYGIEDIYREAVTDKNWMAYHSAIDSTNFSIAFKEIFDEMKKNRDDHLLPSREVMKVFERRYKQKMTELEYDAALKLAVEKKVFILPAEDAELHKKAGELLKGSWVDQAVYKETMDTLFRKRELYALKEGNLLLEPMVVLFFGGMHAKGMEKSSLIRSIKEHNADPKNKYDQYCAVILTPDHYPED